MVSDPPDSMPDEPASTAPATKKPLLASEALMDDLAPQEPWRTGARYWSVLAGLLLLATTLPGWLSTDIEAGVPSLAAGGVALLAGLLPLPYVVRAVVMLGVAATVVGLSFVDLGPVAALRTSPGLWWLTHLAAATTLPAALMFRERYRALARARYVLGASLLLTVGFVVFGVLTFTTSSLAVQIASVVALIAVVLSLLGFMGAQAPLAGSLLAALMLASVAGQLATVVVDASTLAVSASGAAPVVSVLGFVGTALLGTLALAQLLAAASYNHARSIDFRRMNTDRPKMPSLTSDSWSGRR